jgi:hypothetical protein
VIKYVSYREEHYSSPAHCVRGIRDLVQLGWVIVEVRGPEKGPFFVLCRKDDES